MRLQYRMKCANQFVSSRRRYEITSVATGLNRTETLQIAAINATAVNESTKREAKLEALTAQLDSAFAIRLDIIARMREDGLATGSALAARDRALVGVTDYNQRMRIDNETQAQLSARWKSNAQFRLKNEIAVYDALVSLTAAWESVNLLADNVKETTLWAALGAYWKGEIAKDANYAITLGNAECAYQTSINSAEQATLNAQIMLESNYDQALTTAAVTATTSEFTQTKNFYTSEYASYFNAVNTACQNMPNSDVGDFYSSIVSAAQTDYNAQWSADTTYFNSVLAKEEAYANTTRSIDATYSSSAVSAMYGYFNSQIVSNVANINRTKTADEAEIDARVAYYIACNNADYAQSVATLDAQTQAWNWRLDLLLLWPQHVLDKNWTYDTIKYGGYDGITYSLVQPNNIQNLTYFGFTGGTVTTIPTASTVDGISIPGYTSGAPSYFAGLLVHCDYLLWRGYNATTLWTSFDNLNNTTKAFAIKNAELACEASKANAASQYVSTYGAIYGAEAVASLNAAGLALAAELTAEQALNASIWNASETAHNATLNAVVANDDSTDVATYINASVNGSLNYARSVASAFGTLQIDNRQTRYNNASANDPRRALYSQDVTWATNTKSLRDQYYTATNNAISDYYASITQAYTDYVSDTLTALTTAERAYFNAVKSYSINALDADAAYATALFNAERTRALAYVNASIAELTGNYSTEAQLAAGRAGAYAIKYDEAGAVVQATQFYQGRGLQISVLFNATSTEQSAYFDEIVSAATQVATIKNNADSADATAASQNQTALANAKAGNAADYELATANAENAYATSANSAWNGAYITQLSHGGTLKDGCESINDVNYNATDAAFQEFDVLVAELSDGLEASIELIAKANVNKQALIDSGQTIGSDVFDEPTLDFEVCFVAGTLVLMADGTKKPIEEIQPGDMVMAVDHLNPEEKPGPARVARTFDNGLKEVVKLRFAKDGVEEEIVCTPSHRFYIVGRGWVCASEITVGDFGLTADGKRLKFAGLMDVEEKVIVYNFEVEEKHSYYVGWKDILVHNQCDKCHGQGYYWRIKSNTSIIGKVITSEAVLCDCIKDKYNIDWKGEWDIKDQVRIIGIIDSIQTRLPFLNDQINRTRAWLVANDEMETLKQIDWKLKEYRDILNEIKTGLDEGEYKIRIIQYSYESQGDEEIPPFFRNEDGLISGVLDRIALNTNPKADWHKQSDDDIRKGIFHELTHSYGTDDGSEDKGFKIRTVRSIRTNNPLLNAHNIESLINDFDVYMRNGSGATLIYKPWFNTIYESDEIFKRINSKKFR